jgi:RimJ/RimL family protein N-acetyltransferase
VGIVPWGEGDLALLERLVGDPAQVVAMARSERRHPFLHAFPSVDNAPSNAICRKLGFTLLGECELEYPPGRVMRCSDWRLELFA